MQAKLSVEENTKAFINQHRYIHPDKAPDSAMFVTIN